MSKSQLPKRASLEYLRKLAKDRLRELHRREPRAKLAAVLLEVAREYGFSSWRALKAELEQRQAHNINLFFDACANGDLHSLRTLLENDASLVRASRPNSRYQGWTGLHSAAQRGHVDAVRLLLEHGADPNARESGDNTYPLHWAAAIRQLEVVQVLVGAGGDVHGIGDVHELEAIGWATFFHPPGGKPGDQPEVASFLVKRGANHHIFSAMSLGDLDLIRKLVEENPRTLLRRMSRFEHGLTPLHFAMNQNRYDILDLLIELGANLEAKDQRGQTALAVAMLRGDREAMARLHAAGAKQPKMKAKSSFNPGMAKLADSIKKGVPMIYVPDVARALDWYVGIGFKEIARYGDDNLVNFGMVSFGKAELMLNMHGKPGAHDVSLWFYTDQVDRLYELLKDRQLKTAQAALAGEPGNHAGIDFEQDIEDMFYGARQFGIRDLNGYVLYFIQSRGS
jgi:ankyrin repeat protein